MSDSVFDPTPWSAVLQAAGGDPERARRGFERLCGEYRDAIAHWMRLQRLSKEDAEDATHDFLEQWLRRDNPLQNFQRGERRFREFLRVCLRNFLADWRARPRAARRGGGAEHLPWEHDDLIADGADAHAHLDFALATHIHAHALARLRAQWQSLLGADGQFDRLHAVALDAADSPGYGALASELQAPVGTVKSWVFRFRREYHAAFRQAVEQQADPALIDHDVLHLHQLLLNPPQG
jgi:DNA-directed RNA polymerase specialized sigma24 family protein